MAANPNDRATIQSLRLTIEEAMGYLRDGQSVYASRLALSILQAAYDNTDPKLLDKDCGCG